MIITNRDIKKHLADKGILLDNEINSIDLEIKKALFESMVYGKASISFRDYKPLYIKNVSKNGKGKQERT